MPFLYLCLQVLNSPNDTLKLVYALASKSTNDPTRVEARRIFDSFDPDKSGEWDITEWKSFFSTLEHGEELGDAKAIFKAIDKDGAGSIDFDEFHAWHVATLDAGGRVKRKSAREAVKSKSTSGKPVCKTRDEVRGIFDSFDPDKSGEWDITEWKAFLSTLEHGEELGDGV